ncbi:MAG: VOC family protein [Elusimicrobia bacterium]|nr:VOC family protein [Elusimicrobiota bacterium]
MPNNEVKPIPDGYHTVTPYLSIKEAAKAIEFYQKAFGATVKERMDGPGGKVMHAELKFGDSIVMLADEYPEMPGACLSPATLKGTTFMIHLYVENVDAAFKKAVDAGCVVERPVQDQFYGDRTGGVRDPFGHRWYLGTHKEDLTPEQLKQRAQEMFKQPKKETSKA